MIDKILDSYRVAFIRGATTATGNSVEEIKIAVIELINELISHEIIYCPQCYYLLHLQLQRT